MKDKSHIQCFKCKGYGHYANRCPGREKKEEAAHHARAEMEPALGLMFAVAERSRSRYPGSRFRPVRVGGGEL